MRGLVPDGGGDEGSGGGRKKSWGGSRFRCLWLDCPQKVYDFQDLAQHLRLAHNGYNGGDFPERRGGMNGDGGTEASGKHKSMSEPQNASSLDVALDDATSEGDDARQPEYKTSTNHSTTQRVQGRREGSSESRDEVHGTERSRRMV